jgi:uncharacterized protein (TIGR04552 family)
MRRDILELDSHLDGRLRELSVNLRDAESVRLLLTGASVVDWQRLAFADVDDVDAFIASQGLDPHEAEDRERLRYVFNEALSYLEEHLHLRFPQELRDPADVRQIFLWASQYGGFRRTQILSCVILKLMHVIHHMEAADLKFKTTISEEQLLQLAQHRLLRTGHAMQEAGLPVVAFYGNRKSRSSVITKLLAKREAVAATIFDKLRFRIVVERREDLLPALAWLTRHGLPFNYVVPDQSHNNLLPLREVLAALPESDRAAFQEFDSGEDDGPRNEFSGSTYRTINWIVDYPVRIPATLPGSFSFELGRVVFVMVEFQLLDEETAQRNEQGENAHSRYKGRQHRVVASRLKRGSRQE